jgi:hypothetical protein
MQYDYSGKRDKSYLFDNAFSANLSNQQVYSTILEPLIPNILEGYNVTCFAYGMTGAGKTHTMIGDMTSPYITDDSGLCFKAI